MEAVIKVSHLTKTFSELTAVNDLSFTVQKGDVYGFLGQNGAGKSTLLQDVLQALAEIFGIGQLRFAQLSCSVVQFLHGRLPFGGVNNSGLGSAHGIYGFKAFSHERAVYIHQPAAA